MTYLKSIKILLSIFSFISLIVILSLLAAKAIRAEMVSSTQYHEVVCKLEKGIKVEECIELEVLSNKLKNLAEEMSVNEVAACAIIKTLKLGIIERNCSKFDSAKELKNEIEVIKNAFDTVQKHN